MFLNKENIIGCYFSICAISFVACMYITSSSCSIRMLCGIVSIVVANNAYYFLSSVTLAFGGKFLAHVSEGSLLISSFIQCRSTLSLCSIIRCSSYLPLFDVVYSDRQPIPNITVSQTMLSLKVERYCCSKIRSSHLNIWSRSRPCFFYKSLPQQQRSLKFRSRFPHSDDTNGWQAKHDSKTRETNRETLTFKLCFI